jgi:hypothetical protein
MEHLSEGVLIPANFLLANRLVLPYIPKLEDLINKKGRD